MTVARRTVEWLAMVLGLLGILVCLTSLVAVWSVVGTLNRTTQRGAQAIDETIAIFERRLSEAELQVSQARDVSQSISQRLKDGLEQVAVDRVLEELKVEERATRLSGGLQRADDWLVGAESSVTLWSQLIGDLGWTRIHDTSDGLLEAMSELRNRLAQIQTPVQELAELRAKADGAEKPAGKIARIRAVAGRVLLMVADVESRLENTKSRLVAMRETIRELEDSIGWWISIAATVISALILWMAAGQAALCYLGWPGRRRPMPDSI